MVLNGECFRDSHNRVLNGFIRKFNDHVTVHNCKEFCLNFGYAFAGVENARECFCGQTPPTELIQDSECDRECKGDNTQICGGSWALNVYSLIQPGF